jgi:tetratricopeptide (TPR) repeat protein
MATFASTDDDDNCAICLEPIADPYELGCGHIFCRGCINAYKERGVNDVCPYCRAPLPPGAAQSVVECHKMTARIRRYHSSGDSKRKLISHRVQLHHARQAVHADPQHAEARCLLAYGLDNVQADSDGAMREYREAIRIDPRHAGAHLSLGVLLSSTHNDYDGAEREFREAIRINPNFLLAHLSLGCILMTERDDCAAAEDEFREALRIDPYHAKAREMLQMLLEQKAVITELQQRVLDRR